MCVTITEVNWLNVGVQVFLLLSGFLYGNKHKIDPKTFYWKNIPKILIDYWFYVALMVPVYLFVANRNISMNEYIRLLLGISVGIPGMGHLWYISTILVCYIITPLVFRQLRPKVNVLFILLLFVVSEIVFAVLPGFTGAWINCFVFGMLLGNDRKKAKDYKLFSNRVLSFATPAMIILCGI